MLCASITHQGAAGGECLCPTPRAAGLLRPPCPPQAAPTRSVFLLHACAHNPTGVDPTPQQWSALSKAMLDKGHFPMFDMAYQVRTPVITAGMVACGLMCAATLPL